MVLSRTLRTMEGCGLGATALANGLTLVTRSDCHVAGLGAVVLNPFECARGHPSIVEDIEGAIELGANAFNVVSMWHNGKPCHPGP